MKFLSAPLQGYTDAPWRHFHNLIYGGVDGYYTPFLRVEKYAVRPRDLKDLRSSLNDSLRLVPQIIFGSTEEFEALVGAVVEDGHHRVDLNLGCPFPPQVKRGRGAGALRKDFLREIGARMRDGYSDIEFSVKMRLGVSAPDEWRDIVDEINAMPLSSVTVHPRTASQQYGGTVHENQFADLLSAIAHKIIYNGDLRSVADIRRITDEYPSIAGVMVGRGLLGRPSLGTEWFSQQEWGPELSREKLLEFHEALFRYYEERLCGESQLLTKMKTFWDYAGPEIGHKTAKAIKKAVSLEKYSAAVASI